MKKTFLVFVIIFFLKAFIFSSGGVGDDFLRVNPIAKSASMSNAYCAIGGDTSSIFFNPAGIILVKKPLISLTHFASFGDTNYENFSVVYPLGDFGATGLGILYNYTFSFFEYDEFGEEAGKIDNRDITITLSYSYPVISFLSLGANIKYFNSLLYRYSKTGLACDIGTLIKINKNPDFFGAFVIQNIGYQTAYLDIIDEMPTNIKAGVSCKFAIFNDIVITIAFDTNRLIKKDELPTLDIGGDLCFAKFFSIRAGIGLRHDTERFSLGFGINMQNVRFSYAFQPFDFLGDTHRITLDIEFGR
jgi:hypothetical protein